MAEFRNAAFLSQDEINLLIDLYDASIRYVDENIGRLLRNLGSLKENTIIIITADHGDSFGEHNTIGHCTLYEEVINVPLIITGPGLKAGINIEKPSSLIDLAPTITDLVDLGNTEGWCGSSILQEKPDGGNQSYGTIITSLIPKKTVNDDIKETNIIPEDGLRLISYRTNKWKYIMTETLSGDNKLISEEIYNLSNDPQETNNMNEVESELVSNFKSLAKNQIMEFKRQKSEEQISHEKERIKARLGNLPRL
jgi:arylsulfatase A-like enzyme